MTRKEYKEILEYELYGNIKPNFINRIRIKYFQPNTNCMYLARKMWYYYTKSSGGADRMCAKLLYLKIFHKYGCCIYANAEVAKGFRIAHPVGIVIGKCKIGENFAIYQNSTVGVKNLGDEAKGLTPVIGNNVRLCSNSCILGSIHITDDVIIGANSVVIKDIDLSGTYVGSPVKKVI